MKHQETFDSASEGEQQGSPRIHISHNRMRDSELKWTLAEKRALEERILALQSDQIGALVELVGLEFARENIDDIVQDIQADGLRSGHLEVVLAEADSKQALFWWIEYFERHNRRIS